MQTINIAVAEDNNFYQEGLISILSDIPCVEVAGAVNDGSEVEDLMKRATVDIFFMDIRMPEKDGIQATRWLKQHYPDVKVLALTMYTDEHLIVEMVEAGVVGYINKNAQLEQISQAIKSISDGFGYFCPQTSHQLTRLIYGSSMMQTKKVQFSQQEIAIINLITREFVNKEIAEQLHLSPYTVETYRLRIQQKMGVKSTTGMIIYAYKNGLIED